MTFLLSLLAYVVIGLNISRVWYRRQRWPSDDEVIEAVLIVVFWPLFLIGWPLARFLRWFYTTPRTSR
ncbi:hypothetical protein FHT44_005195 [Mycolicibacterium sp. BK634]|nr:hypothetical protein [Mycolicibacterium sp. BK634]